MEKELNDYYFFLRMATCTSIRHERRKIFAIIDGEVFYRLKLWPEWMKQVFWNKPLTDKSTFVLFLFLYGNGCPPTVIFKWVLSSQFWALHPEIQAKKRERQMKWIMNNIAQKKNVWYYFDMHHKKIMYFNGQIKNNGK